MRMIGYVYGFGYKDGFAAVLKHELAS
jgi:hypothetical protein